MSHKNPKAIKIKSEITVNPELTYTAEVVKSGSGAVIHSYKRFLGYNAVVILEKPFKESKKEKDAKLSELTQLDYDLKSLSK